MSERQLCKPHGIEAISKCLYHWEPICDECKFNERHKDCPKEYVSVSLEISRTDSNRLEMFNDFQGIFATALKIRDQNQSRDNDQLPKDLTEILNAVFNVFKSKADVLLADVLSYIDKSTSKHKQQSIDVQNACDRMLTDVGTILKQVVEKKMDLSRLPQRSKQFQKILLDKETETRNCDLKSLLTLELGCLLQQEKMVPLPQAILSSSLIDCLYPPVLNPKLTLLDEMEIEPPSPTGKKPLITGCTLLRTGCLVVVDKANSVVKIFNTTNTIIKFDVQPYDITEKDGNLCVSLPYACKIVLIENPESKHSQKAVISTETKCYGVEYGGKTLVVACHVSTIDWPLSRSWLFRMYGNKYNLLQVVEKDRIGRPFYLSNGYFDFCPFRDQILFLTTSGTAARFHLTGPSCLESLGKLGSRQEETLTAIRSCGNMLITCHTENYYYHWIPSLEKSTLRFHNPSQFPASEISFEGTSAGPMYFNAKSRKLVVFEGIKSDKFYVYNV